MEIEAFRIPIEDRVAFLKFMVFVASSDGRPNDEESSAIEQVMSNWGLDAADRETVRRAMDGRDVLNMTVLASQLQNASSKYLLVQELITLASLDGAYLDAERKAVRDIAQSLGVSSERVCQMESWVAEGMAWRQKGVELVTPEGE